MSGNAEKVRAVKQNWELGYTISREETGVLLTEIERLRALNTRKNTEITKLRRICWLAALFEKSVIECFLHPSCQPRKEVRVWRRREFCEAMNIEYHRMAQNGRAPLEKRREEFQAELERAREIICIKEKEKEERLARGSGN